MRNRRSDPPTLIACCLLALAIALTPAPTRAESDDTAPEPTAIRIPLADGAELVGNLFLPEGKGPHPTLISVSPYDVRVPYREQMASAFAADGYAALWVNARGKFGSTGTFLPFIDEIPDLTAILEWALAQDWSNGKVGLYGNSSSSYSAQLLASTGHPAIKALVNKAGLNRPQEVIFPGGAFRLDTMYPWLMYFYLGDRVPGKEWAERLRATPLSKGFGWEPGIPRKMARGAVNNAGIRTPILHIVGWNDVVYRQTFFLNEGVRQAGGDDLFQKMVIGPWAHNYDGETTKWGEVDFGPQSRLSMEDERALIVRFLDRFVGGEDNGIDREPCARLFVMGQDAWVDAESWPVPGTETRTWYLDSAGVAAAPNRGRLVDSAPKQTSSLTFAYDPNDPVPTHGGVNSHLFPAALGPMDQTRFLERPDVLVFTGEPASEDLTIVGRMKATLFASSDHPAADFTAKLVEVRADGTHRIIEDGIIRARFRESFEKPKALKPGKVYPLEIDLGWTAISVARGNRLALHVSAGNFPKYDRNPNTMDDPFDAATLEAARQTVHLSPRHPSRIELEVIPAKAAERLLRP